MSETQNNTNNSGTSTEKAETSASTTSSSTEETQSKGSAPSQPKVNKHSAFWDTDIHTKLTLLTIFCFAGGILIFLALFNQAGQFGNLVGAFMFMLMGRGAFVFPIFLFICGSILIRIQQNAQWHQQVNSRLWWGTVLMVLAFNGLLSLIFGVNNLSQIQNGGGLVGYLIYPWLFGFFGLIGGLVLIFCLWFFGFYLISQLTIGEFIRIAKQSLKTPSSFWDLVPDFFELTNFQTQTAVTQQTTNSEVTSQTEDKKQNAPTENKSEPLEVDNLVSRQQKLKVEQKIETNTTEYSNIDQAPTSQEKVETKEVPESVYLFFQKKEQSNQATPLEPEEIDEREKLWEKLQQRTDAELTELSAKESKATTVGTEKSAIDEQTPVILKKAGKPLHWVLPGFDLLKETDKEEQRQVTSQEEISQKEQIIKSTLESFNIKVEMGPTIVGPTVTRFTFRPASGVKLSTINSLQKDLALALAATNMLMQMPIAGQSWIGIEIANTQKIPVRLKEILQTDEFIAFQGPLPVAIGKDVAGNNIIYSITKMPHLLVAGATGAGKSVWINSLLLSLLYRYSPADLQLILVDMKRVELKLYEKIPHLLTNVITDAVTAINALKWTVLEMDRRYRLLEEFGKRNIVDFNQFAIAHNLQTLSYIIFVIDELGDLMLVAKNEVEPIIVRLTQMSRAVGIHLILGTQRPDTSVVTGLIKANVPSRIAFAVVSQVDSRVILDSVGAEKLLGQGDGLFMSPSTIQPIRFQGALVEESEVRECVKFLKIQAAKNGGVSNYRPEITERPILEVSVPGLNKRTKTTTQNKQTSFSKTEVDLLTYEKAKQLVEQYEESSLDFLKQALGIETETAEKIRQQLVKDGIIKDY